MDKWNKPPPRRGGYGYEHPSFSSTLLDAIYRSIDESDGGGQERRTGGAPVRTAPFTAHDSWRRPAVTERPVTRHKPEPEHSFRRVHSVRVLNSTSSSSDSSSYGGFSSSEADSARVKPIRTGSRSDPPSTGRIPFPAVAEKKKSSSIRSKIKELRRAKAPASPGARLASFLNSIFTSAAGNPKKVKPGAAEEPSSAPASACSTASSYSRSCLSKTPSTRGEKRSVRFYPVSVIVDADSRPCGEKRIYGRGDVAAEARKRVDELMKRFEDQEDDDDDDDDDDNDDESDSSSDLFELENFTAIGGGGGGRRYRDELPVYGTTNLGTNRAIISNGLVL